MSVYSLNPLGPISLSIQIICLVYVHIKVQNALSLKSAFINDQNKNQNTFSTMMGICLNLKLKISFQKLKNVYQLNSNTMQYF